MANKKDLLFYNGDTVGFNIKINNKIEYITGTIVNITYAIEPIRSGMMDACNNKFELIELNYTKNKTQIPTFSIKTIDGNCYINIPQQAVMEGEMLLLEFETKKAPFENSAFLQ